MSSFRLPILFLPLVAGLALLTGACGAPLAVSAVSYGSDGAMLAATHKTGTDHLASMVSKKDCALWRAFRGRDPDVRALLLSGALMGLAVTTFAFLGVNMFLSGLHSYGAL